jgi:hypothetical protein
MSRNEDEWIETHIQILRELSPEDLDERVLNQKKNLQKLLEILSRTLSKLEDYQSMPLDNDNEKPDDKGGY